MRKKKSDFDSFTARGVRAKEASITLCCFGECCES